MFKYTYLSYTIINFKVQGSAFLLYSLLSEILRTRSRILDLELSIFSSLKRHIFPAQIRSFEFVLEISNRQFEKYRFGSFISICKQNYGVIQNAHISKEFAIKRYQVE